MAPDTLSGVKGISDAERNQLLHCCGLKLLEGSLDLQIRPCHTLLPTMRGLLATCRSLFSQCAMLLLTSMPCPRCPTCPECPSPASHLANHPSRLRPGDHSRKPFLRLPGWVSWPLCVSSSWSLHMSCVISSCCGPSGRYSSRARARSFCPSL